MLGLLIGVIPTQFQGRLWPVALSKLSRQLLARQVVERCPLLVGRVNYQLPRKG